MQIHQEVVKKREKKNKKQKRITNTEQEIAMTTKETEQIGPNQKSTINTKEKLYVMVDVKQSKNSKEVNASVNLLLLPFVIHSL